jgi:tetratricopeptide (TPR) repeat protein
VCLGWIWFRDKSSGDSDTTLEPGVTVPIVSETQKIEQKKGLRVQKERASDALLSSERKKERAILLSKKADYLGLNNEYHDALDLYERVIALSPLDEYKKKAAAMAFEARNFTKSIAWYTETLSSLSLRQKEELLMSMRYTGDKEFHIILSSIDIPPYIKQAYEVSWICENTFIDCETSIKKY